MKKWARKTGCLGRQDEKVPTDNSIPNWPRFFKKERAFRSWLSDAGPSAVHHEARPVGAHDQGTWKKEHKIFACIDAALTDLSTQGLRVLPMGRRRHRKNVA